MKVVWYEDKYCYYVWKPAGIPSTFGKEKSFLEYMFEDKSFLVVKKLMMEFKRSDEYGLLNRLDNSTTGLLYFAKNKEIKAEYKRLQNEGRVRKYYLLEVYGDLQYWIKLHGNVIDYPVAHHKFSKDRMVVIRTEKDLRKGEHRLHGVQTKIEEYYRNEVDKTTVLVVSIQKGIRHQIRSHFSSIGYPIVGDDIYGKKGDLKKGNLQLYSIGLSVV